MLILGRILSVLSVAFTVIFAFVMIGVARFNLLQLGFEGTGVAASLSFFCAALFALLALAIAILLLLRLQSKTTTRIAQVVLIPAICLIALGVVSVFGSM
jgi:ABC-type Na+ efflux pump permease subunit